MKTFLLLLLLAISCYSQDAPKSPDEVQKEPDKCVHDSDEDFYESIRHSGPVQITHADGRTLTTVQYGKYLVKHTTYQMNERSRVPKDFYRMDLKRRWFLLICYRHLMLLVAEPIK